MVSIFLSYIKNISICIIFTAFVEMLLPNDNFKKYINLILGFIIIIVILNPIKNFMSSADQIDFKVFSISSKIDNDLLLNQKSIQNKQKDLIISTYKQQLEQQIKKIISEQTDLKIENISIEVDEDFESDTFSQIQHIELYAQSQKDVAKEEQMNITTVEKIIIGQNKEDNGSRDEELEKTLKTLISNFYKLNKDNIYIIVHRK